MNILRLASLLFLWLSYAAAENVTLEEEQDGATTASSAVLKNMTMLLYTGDTVDNYTSVLVGDAADLVNYINSSKPTVLYVFGWTESPSSTSTETVVGAYLERGDHNVIVINWEDLSSNPYYDCAYNVGNIGKTFATAIDDIVAAGLNSSTIHIVSHSLGSQIAGFIGRNLNFTVPRVTGLDPAGVAFSGEVFELNSSDAEFVDIIHTDAGQYGTTTATGTVNFFPHNGTYLQPGCTSNDLCSHRMSWRFYAESLLNEDAFIGVACDSYAEFELGSCSNKTAVMGYGTPTTITGNYYLQTNSASPYGKGEEGETYVAS